MADERSGAPVIVAVILLASIGAALFLTGLMRDSSAAPGSSFPTEAQGLQVINVADAIAIQAKDDASDLAVSGWFQHSMAVPCPPPPDPVVELLNGDCTIDMTWLMAEPESLIHTDRNSAGSSSPASPAVNPVFDGPLDIAWARPLPQIGDSVPTPVVFVGHFDDARAAGCQPADQGRCRDRFVVTVVAWADGVENP